MNSFLSSTQKYSKNTYFHGVKPYYFFLLLLLCGACTLSSDQEASLHNAMVSYINAKNEGVATAYVAYTFPEAVAYYKEQGDSVFQERYDLSMGDLNPFLQDGIIQRIEKNNMHLHVEYLFREIDFVDYDVPARDVVIIAISKDAGVSWSFIDEEDYYNDAIIDAKSRLLK